MKKVINIKTKEEFAAKIIRRCDIEYIIHYQQEFNLLQSLSHPNILKVNKFIKRESHQSLVIIMEFLDSYTLGDLIRLDKLTKSNNLS